MRRVVIEIPLRRDRCSSGTDTGLEEMADAQLMEEELQQSVRVSEEDADVENVDAEMDGSADNQTTSAGADDIDAPEDDSESLSAEEDNESGGEEQDAVKEENALEASQSEDDSGDDDAEGEEDDNFEDAEGLDDAEGEDDDDDEVIARPLPTRGTRTRSVNAAAEGDEDDGEEAEDEQVGAVKIRPGETDEEDEESETSASIQAGSGSDSDEVAEEWEEAAEQQQEDEDDESDVANANVCMFCKQDEDNDPGEEFEAYLACSHCGEHSHQQCARDAKALNGKKEANDNWKCPDCADDEQSEDLETTHDAEVNGNEEEGSSPGARRTSAPKLARDLLPSQKGPMKPDSHSVFNHLVLDDDPMDGSRILRKRKTSSAEADESIMSLRKRRRNTGDEQSGEATNNTEDPVRPHSARSLRLKVSQTYSATIQKRTRTTLIVKMRVNTSSLREILSRKPKKKEKQRRRSDVRPGTARSTATATSIPTAPFVATSFSQPFYSFYDKETDELKGKPYGGILTEVEADTSKTMPSNDDRRRFDEAKQKAEEEWRQRVLAMQAETELPTKKSKKTFGPASQIECIEFGGWEIDTWYAAPYPEEYSRNRVLFICEFCLKYMNSDYVAWRHKLKCPAKAPPGDEIYRHGSVSFFEVDGRKNPVYCQNLCLLAKLFLGSKTLYYDVEPFLFYVLCEYDDMGYHFVGYFSKEKRASSQNNVSCILTLPIHQRKGYGNLLIDFSYLLTRVEEKTGSPEKPLSDMGLVSYRNYWRLIMCRYLLDHISEDKESRRGMSIKQISEDTGMTPDDVISALEGLRCLVRDPQTKLYAFRVDLDYCREFVGKWESKKYVQLKPKVLTWTPYVMGRSNATNFELGPAINAIAPREEEDEVNPTAAVAEVLTNGDGVVAAAALSNGVDEKVVMDDNDKAEVGSPVLESTEPNDGQVNGEKPIADNDNKVNGIEVNGEAADLSHPPENAAGPDADADADSDWAASYHNIPPTRFEVFPKLGRSLDRARSTVSRPPAVRTASSVSRPRPRRSLGGRKSSSASKPRSGSSKRKSGGTGRGPGRWPKGTKKSDYGNADSGPGLPPAWVAERNRLATMEAEKRVAAKKKVEEEAEEEDDDEEVDEEEEEAGDTVQVKNSKDATSEDEDMESDADSE